MKFDKYIKIGVLGIALWSLTGCTDWLDVQPVDQVAEEQMFTSEEGFRQGLNGVYGPAYWRRQRVKILQEDRC